MKVTIITIFLLLSACAGVLGELPGVRWRLALAPSDQRLEADSVVKIGQAIADRFQMVIVTKGAEPRRSPGAFVILSDAVESGTIHIRLQAMRSGSEIVFVAQRLKPTNDLQQSADAIAERVLSLLKELYPHSTAKQFTASQGWLKP